MGIKSVFNMDNCLLGYRNIIYSNMSCLDMSTPFLWLNHKSMLCALCFRRHDDRYFVIENCQSWILCHQSFYSLLLFFIVCFYIWKLFRHFLLPPILYVLFSKICELCKLYYILILCNCLTCVLLYKLYKRVLLRIRMIYIWWWVIYILRE